MKDNFAASLKLTLVYEGGWSNNRADPGGATMCGVTQRVYDEDREARHVPLQSVRSSTEAERVAIYRKRYWNMVRGDELPAGVDYAVFDFAVNSGVGRSVKTLQHLVGVTADGAMGPRTLEAVQDFAKKYGADAITDGVCTERAKFLGSLSTFATFGRGWMRRVMGEQDGHQSTDTGVIDRAYVMAKGEAAKAPIQAVSTTKTYLA